MDAMIDSNDLTNGRPSMIEIPSGRMSFIAAIADQEQAWASSRSKYSARLVAPRGSGGPYAIFAWRLNPWEYAIGTLATRIARSKMRTRSRCDVNRAIPIFSYAMR